MHAETRTTPVPVEIDLYQRPVPAHVPYQVQVATAFSDDERAELGEILSVRASPYADPTAFLDEIQRLLPRIPRFFRDAVDALRARDLRQHPVHYLKNCPVGEVPLLDFDAPLESKYALKRDFVAESFLAVFAELCGTPIVTYRMANRGDLFHDIVPVRQLQFSKSQKSIRSLHFHNHPLFDHWLESKPTPEIIGAFYHHMQAVCSASRPGWSFDEGLERLGMDQATRTLRAIVASEENHGPHLATMAGFLMNRASGQTIHPDLADQEAVETIMKRCSDEVMGGLPGYDRSTGLSRQNRRVNYIYARRQRVDRDSTLRNIGTLLATEIIASGHVFPGQLRALYDSGYYGARQEDPEMEYLFEHAGSEGAEAWHAETAIEATGLVLDAETEPLIRAGAMEILDALEEMWDLLDATMLVPEDEGDLEALRPMPTLSSVAALS